MYYKNVSMSVKTFYGVTFKPGEIKEVKNYINHKFMVLVTESEAKKVTKASSTEEKTSPQPVKQQKPSSEKPKKNENEVPTTEPVKEEIPVETSKQEKADS